jgi:hypothetical protein
MEKKMEMTKELKGVGGWLWWYIYVVQGGVCGIFVGFLALAALAAKDPIAWYYGLAASIALVASKKMLKMEPNALTWGRVSALLYFNIVWLIYLYKSERVRNTYGPIALKPQPSASLSAQPTPDYKPYGGI